MKNERIRAALAMTALGTVLLGFACQSGCVNQTANTNQTILTATNVSPSQPEDPCNIKAKTVDEIKHKAEEINKAINAEINADDVLKGKRNAGDFSISVFQDNKYTIAMTVKGTVTGDGKFKDLDKVFDKYLRKACVQALRFEPTNKNTNTNTATATVISDFTWLLCEPPLNACPDGECRTSCLPGLTPPPNANSNTNSNTAPNSNSNRGNTKEP